MLNQIEKTQDKKVRVTGAKKLLAKWGGWIAISALLLVLWQNRQPVLELLALVRDRQALIQAIQAYGLWAPVLLSIVIMLQVIFAAIPGHLLMVSSGYIYGLGAGFLISWLNTVAASEFTFFLARRFGRPVVERLASIKVIDRWKRVADNQGFTFFLLSFLLPIFPADLMAYVGGLSAVKPKQFFFANLIGRIPVALLMVLMGSHGFALTTPQIVGILIISVLSLVFFFQFTKKVEQRYQINQPEGEQS
jgi:uncharacterized membrane protein YdjX (TVP38/TMEM64 family)